MKTFCVLILCLSLVGCTQIPSLSGSGTESVQEEARELTLTGLLTKDGETYTMSGPEDVITVTSKAVNLEEHVGKTVQVTGKLQKNTFTVDKLELVTD